jgi:hypothetical protein
MANITKSVYADGIMSESNITTNYSSNIGLRSVSTSGNRFGSILTFDISSDIPANSTIDSATLSLYAYTGANSGTSEAYRMLRNDYEPSEFCWAYYKGTTSWGTAGCLNSTTDYTTTNSASSNNVADGNWQEWDIKDQVQYALDSNSGLIHIFINTVSSSVINYYYSSNYTDDTSLRPKLEIEYTDSSFTPIIIQF